MRETIAVIGTLDTKGDQMDCFIRNIKKRTTGVTVIDVGVHGDPDLECKEIRSFCVSYNQGELECH
jgi:uncharacterized protein (UPF0261 family)